MEIALVTNPTLLAALAFFAIFIFFLGVFQYYYVSLKKRELIGKIRGDDITVASAGNETAPLRKILKTTLDPVLGLLSNLGRFFSTEKTAEYPQLRMKFLKAGLRRRSVPHIYWGAKCFLVICLPVSFFIGRATLFKIQNNVIFLTLCFLCALIGFYLPDIWLRVKTARRKAKIMEALPDALDLLVICVEAGLGLDAAINRVAQEITLRSEVLSDELKMLNLEMRAGKLRQDALRNLAKRTDLEAVSSLVTLLVQTEKFGTSIAQALKVYSDSFRTQRYQKAEEVASKLPIKLLFPLIFFIFPSLFVVILGPAVIRFYEVVLIR
jgi:tight adherence protein C